MQSALIRSQLSDASHGGGRRRGLQEGYDGTLLWSAATLDSSYGCDKTVWLLASVLQAASFYCGTRIEALTRTLLTGSTGEEPRFNGDPDSSPDLIFGIFETTSNLEKKRAHLG